MLLTAEHIETEMRDILKFAGWQSGHGDSVKERLAAAARKLGISPSFAKRLYYGEARIIEAHVADNMRRAYQRLVREQLGRLEEKRRILELEMREWDRSVGFLPRSGSPEDGGE